MTQTLQQPRRAAPAELRRRPVRRWPSRMVPIVLILLGVAVLIYPIVATEYNNYKQQEFAQKYGNQVQNTPAETLHDDLMRARAYNAMLKPSALMDPWSRGSQGADNPAYQDYLSQLNRYDSMARLRIPSVKTDLPIYHGTDDQTLAKGVGHLFGTTLPVGGPSTHAALTAHSGMSNATLFDELHNVKLGDVFYADVSGETLAYRVDRIDVVLPSDLHLLARVDGVDLITLVTCTPYAVNTHRLLVTGTRVPYEAVQDPGPRTNPITGFRVQPWMHTRLIGAGASLALLLAMILGWIISDIRHRRPRRPGKHGIS